MMDHKGFSILGYVVEDRVSGVVGVATSISFDLYGCVQMLVRPRVDLEGKLPEAHWFDLSRLKRTDDRVMEPIGFLMPDSQDTPGPEQKPII
jgi:hypothetical protein